MRKRDLKVVCNVFMGNWTCKTQCQEWYQLLLLLSNEFQSLLLLSLQRLLSHDIGVSPHRRVRSLLAGGESVVSLRRDDAIQPPLPIIVFTIDDSLRLLEARNVVVLVGTPGHLFEEGFGSSIGGQFASDLVVHEGIEVVLVLVDGDGGDVRVAVVSAVEIGVEGEGIHGG